MKKLLFSAALVSALLLGACGDDSSSSNDKKETASAEVETKGKTITDADIQKLYTEPKKFKDYQYDFVGKVFTTPEKDDEGVYLQVFADHENSELNTIVFYEDPDFEVNGDDYVKVSSTVKDVFEGENMLGGKVTGPIVVASSLEVVDYATAVAPTLETIEVNQEVDQNGFLVKVEKIEIAKPHTRVHLSVTNNSEDNISFYQSDVKLILDGKQLDEEYVYEANYPELQSDLLPGITTSGVIVFPTIDESVTNLKIHAEGYSENYELDIKPFVFEINK